MDDIRKVIKKTSPPAVVVQTLRTALTMPPTAAKNIIKDLTRPLGDQKRFIRKFDNEHWKGALIMSEMIRCDDNIALRRLQKADIVIFEVHGGGFRVGHSTMYMDSFISWLRTIKNKYNLYACIMSVEYGLAPKHKYPGPLEECVKAFNYLTKDLGVSPSKVIFSGDSAGGALVLETLMRTYVPSILDNLDCPRENWTLPLPAGVLLSSPLTSAETSSESWKKYAKTDIVSPKLATLIFKEYLDLPKVKVEDLPILRLAHVRKDFDRFMPNKVMVFVGEKEVLRDDILELVDAVKADGKIDIQLIQEKYAHDWFMIHEIIKKKDKAMIAKYDELFADFAVEAVEECKKILHHRPLATTAESISSKNTVAIAETIDLLDQVAAAKKNEKKQSSTMLVAKNDSEKENNIALPIYSSDTDNIFSITAKLDKPFELLEKAEFPKPAQYKPNTILSEYTIITDNPSVSA